MLLQKANAYQPQRLHDPKAAEKIDYPKYEHTWGHFVFPAALILWPRYLVDLTCRSLALVILFTWTAHADSVQIKTTSGETLDLYHQGYHALVVGIEKYDHWPMRPGAVKNARDLSWELRRLGASVRLLTDPDLQELKQALNEFTADSTSDQGLIFYFAGNTHTATSTDGRTSGWLIPKDAPNSGPAMEDLNEHAISADRIAALANQAHSRHMLLLLDAPFLADSFQVRPPVLRVVNSQSALSARQFIAAGHGDAPFTEESVFKNVLLQGLRGEADLIHDGVVSASELALFMSDRIPKITRDQLRPQYGRLWGSEDNGSDFVIRLTDDPHDLARLHVDAQPVTSTIRILNIKPRFRQAMELKPGRYHLQVSAEGHENTETWIDLAVGEDRTVAITLPKLNETISNSLGMRFVRIRPGRFLMGSPKGEPGRMHDETLHRVRLTRHFYVQHTEVTVGQFRQFVQATNYVTETEKSGGCWTAGDGRRWAQKPGTGWQDPGFARIEDNLPVTCVTWHDATAFARWLSDKEGKTYRLPTEAEWEYAGRAGVATPFASGQCLSTDEANYGGPGNAYRKCSAVFRQKRGRPIKVGGLAPNQWKLYDIHGNVSEWCRDWYGPYPTGNVADPTGPKSGFERVMRGGHWQADAANCRLAGRWRLPPKLASDAVGFRLVMVP